MYYQIYKCRKCRNEFGSPAPRSEGDVFLELKNFHIMANGEVKYPPEEMPSTPRLYREHNCPNGDIGVGDFIGYQKEEEE